ncbi:chromosome segregation protein SMC [Colwelliaceae bacterium BS250]
MRLKHIKLAGFKSFVDVTTVPFTEDMTAIVGPNGCGKSNIIDAVRWVLGESSAKNLRGDSMTDVIFNGSSSRKPIGQASVELVFDNTDQRIQGSMADRSQISIRRVLNRDAQNNYFLNGTKCRRKDITDIFLGTGLGPRSYAIIEQGTISKLIESKPQDLRVFIEEAAGISKYKERRKETETRIKHTRENLLRLADIRQELGVQIERLHGQAQAAIRFRELKSRERAIKAELLVLKYQQYQQKLQQFKQSELTIQHTIDQLVSEQRSSELSVINTRENQHASNETLAKLQQQKLSLNTDIIRLEQNIKHAKQRKHSLTQDFARLEQSAGSVELHLKDETAKLAEHQQQITAVAPKLSSIEIQLSKAEVTLTDAHHRQKSWQQHWHDFQQEHSQDLQKLNVNQTKIDATGQLITKLEQRITQVSAQLQALELSRIAKQQQQLTEKQANQQGAIANIENQHQLQLQQAEALAKTLSEKSLELRKFENLLQAQTSKYSALHDSLGQQANWQVEQNDYLTQQNIAIGPKLLSELQVTSPWENALEMVVGQWLQASAVGHWPQQLPLSSALLIKLPANTDAVSKTKVEKGTLAEFVSSNHPFMHVLNHILVATSHDDAKQMLVSHSKQLASGYSIICPEGYWYGQAWLQKGCIEQQSGQLKRVSDCKSLAIVIEQQQQALGVLKNEQQKLDIQYLTVKQVLTALTQQLADEQDKYRDSQQQLSLVSQELEYKQRQQHTYQDELSTLNRSLKEDVLCYQTLLEEQKILTVSNTSHNQTAGLLEQSKDQLDIEIQHSQIDVTELMQQRNELKLKFENRKSSLTSAQSIIKREQQQLQEIQKQLSELAAIQQDNIKPIAQDEQQLQALLLSNSEIDKQQLQIHSELLTSNKQLEKFASSQQILLTKISASKDKLSKLQIDAQSYHIHAKTALDQLAEMQQTVEQVLTQLPSGASDKQWQIHLARINKEVSNLGAINLAAIDEYEVQAERKGFLDKQNTDLESALTILASAIHKIDKESRQKFQDTFEQVNADLKMLFPKVFGGGSAYLDLTGDDLLDTGVTIMARPPGKKNSTIHLLSGGEKALTALSLVFAIFRLNPAPFCMLDEVDAPLDDANVGRFCNLVKEMSQTVQFIYISHNKIAMEMASHLTGVTMQEPGVSRMVAVDIDEAIAMAEES